LCRNTQTSRLFDHQKHSRESQIGIGLCAQFGEQTWKLHEVAFWMRISAAKAACTGSNGPNDCQWFIILKLDSKRIKELMNEGLQT